MGENVQFCCAAHDNRLSGKALEMVLFGDHVHAPPWLSRRELMARGVGVLGAALAASHGVSLARPLSPRLGQSAAMVAPLITSGATPYVLPVYDAEAAAAALANKQADHPIDPRTGYGVATHDLHVHADFSEGTGSTASQVERGARLGDRVVLWLTDHDWRATNELTTEAYLPREYVFDRLTQHATQDVSWKAKGAGKGTLKAAKVIGPQYGDPGGLYLSCRSAAGASASYGVECVTHNYLEGNLVGRRICFDVKPTLSGAATFDVVASFSGRPDAVPDALKATAVGDQLTLVYRFDARATVAGYEPDGSGTTCVVRLPVPVNGGWNRAQLTPLDDIAAVWPGLRIPEATSLTGLNLTVTTRGGSGTVLLPRLELPRLMVGEEALKARQTIIDGYQTLTPVELVTALECSVTGRHMNWLGSRSSTQYGTLAAVCAAIQASGCVSTLNHPFGTTVNTLNSAAQQQTALVKAATYYLKTTNVPFDAVEVYNTRGGAGLGAHVSFADLLFRDGKITTLVGASDDHIGYQTNRSGSRRPDDHFLTRLYSPARSLVDYQAALTAGRASCVSPLHPDLNLFLTLGEQGQTVAEMGDCLVNPSGTGFPLRVFAEGLTSPMSLRVRQQRIDYARNTSTPGTVTIAQGLRPDADGFCTLAPDAVDLSAATALSVHVVDEDTGAVVAMSNPVFSFRSVDPPAGRPDRALPAARVRTAPG